MAGPLSGVKVVEIASIGPGPFCAMMLADMGADVVRVDRKTDPVISAPPAGLAHTNVLSRGRRSMALNLKRPGATEVVLKLVENSDVLIEGFRPGVMESLGLGPEICQARNPRLIYGRMTGWGQHGPLAKAAGHDIDYIALTGALYGIGPADRPPAPPLNLVGDFGGGGMLLAFGLVCALLEARQSGQGQVVDAAMSDGSALLMAMMYGYRKLGRWHAERGSNLFDGSAPFYATYRCADGKYFAVGANEPQFYSALIEACGLADDPDFSVQREVARWPKMKEKLAEVFATRSRDEWVAHFHGIDACVAPVLDIDEAPKHPHNVARKTFIEVEGVTQPAPAPRFSRTPPAEPYAPPEPGTHTEAILAELGYDAAALTKLKAAAAI